MKTKDQILDKDKILDRNKILDREKIIISGLAVQKFALASLHHWQMEAIFAALEGRNSVVVQSPGSGKSMCFIMPPLNDSKIAVVILPTISLMTNQVYKHTELGVKATFLGSAQRDVSGSIKNGDSIVHQSHFIINQMDNLETSFSSYLDRKSSAS